MELKEYYNDPKGVRSFWLQREDYSRNIEYLASQQPEILSLTKPKTFVLGGFYPSNGTPEAFMDLATTLHPHLKDRHIFLDINQTPLTSINKDTYPLRLRAPIERLPFKPGSIDFLFLDFTLNFMNANQRRQFFRSVPKFLTHNGLILAALVDPKLEELLDDLLGNNRRGHWARHRYFEPEEIITALRSINKKPPLKVVYNGGAFGSNLLTLARPNSDFDELDYTSHCKY